MTTTRKPRKTKSAKAADATVKPQASTPEPEATSFSWTDYINKLNEQYGEPNITWKRQLTAFVVGIAVSFGIGYIVAAITEIAMVALIASTGSMFLAVMAWLLGLIIATYIGSKAGTFVFMGIKTKQIDQAYASVKDTVTGWFTKTQGATA